MSINPREIPTGAVRFNTDSSKMEVYIGSTWMEVAVSESTTFGARGLIGGASSNGSIINYYTIATAGDAVDFGDLNNNVDFPGSVASRTRGIWGGGRTPTNLDVIDFVTISTAGNALDFGDLTSAKREMAGVGNQIRGLFCGETLAASDDIEFITISQKGNAVDFGNLSAARDGMAGFASATRGVVAGGYGQAPSYTMVNGIEFLTIATTGNSLDFGDIDSGAGANKAGWSDSHGGLTE